MENLRKRTPAHAVEAHVEIEHRSHRLARRRGLSAGIGRWRVRLEEGADDKEQDTHAHRGDEQ